MSLVALVALISLNQAPQKPATPNTPSGKESSYTIAMRPLWKRQEAIFARSMADLGPRFAKAYTVAESAAQGAKIDLKDLQAKSQKVAHSPGGKPTKEQDAFVAELRASAVTVQQRASLDIKGLSRDLEASLNAVQAAAREGLLIQPDPGGSKGNQPQKQDPGSPSPPDPWVPERTFTAPFTDAGPTAADILHDRGIGRISILNASVFAGSGMRDAFISQDLHVQSGARHLEVNAAADIDAGLIAAAFLGYASAEVIANLRVMHGTTVIASDRVSLGRAVAPVFWVSEFRERRVRHLVCEFNRDPSVATDYQVVLDIETWAGCGGSSSATAFAHTTLNSIHVRFDR